MEKQNSNINSENIYQISYRRDQICGSIERKIDLREIREKRNEENELNTDKYNKFPTEDCF